MITERCTDCAQEVGKREHSGLSNVCDRCWDNRGWLIDNLKTVGVKELLRIQQLIRNRTGEARRAISALRYPTYNI